jgi:RimJ/RimL family protein N-acetyltransferase
VPAATARLTFRAWRDDDFAHAWALYGDPRVTAKVGGPFDETAVRAKLDVELANQREHRIAYWPLFGGDGAFVGACGLKPRDLPRNILELGFYLRPPYWGQGLAVEAGHSVIAHAFDALGVASLFAGHHPENHSSGRTLEKLGFRYAHHELYPPTGLQHPCYTFVR